MPAYTVNCRGRPATFQPTACDTESRRQTKQKGAAAPSENGAPGRIRTSDHQVRSLVLYPTELRARTNLAFPADATRPLRRSVVALPPRREAELFVSRLCSSTGFENFFVDVRAATSSSPFDALGRRFPHDSRRSRITPEISCPALGLNKTTLQTYQQCDSTTPHRIVRGFVAPRKEICRSGRESRSVVRDACTNEVFGWNRRHHPTARSTVPDAK